MSYSHNKVRGQIAHVCVSHDFIILILYFLSCLYVLLNIRDLLNSFYLIKEAILSEPLK